jgi:hypothetical protein
MSSADAARFEAVAGDLLAELGYDVSDMGATPRARLARGSYAVRLGAWNAAATLLQRSPLWRRRHPRL